MMPRLPVNNPRCEVAMMSPVGVTRFCSGMLVLLLPACGEKVGMRGTLHALGLAENPPHPYFALRAKSDLSPRAGRGKNNHAAPSRIGGWNDSAVSHGKKIQVSCDTSVMKVSTSGRPIGLA